MFGELGLTRSRVKRKFSLSRKADGFVLLEVMAAAVILTVGVFALSEAFSGALRMARYEDELMRAAYFLEAGVLVWEKTGKWQAPGEWAEPHRYEEIKDKSMRRGRLYVRLTSASRADELSLTAYRQ